MNRSLYFIALIMSFFCLVSCDREVDTDTAQKAKEALEKSYQYYPVRIGISATYQIDSIYYFDNLGTIVIDTVRGKYKETITDTFRTEDNRLVYRILKEKFDSISSSWSVTNVYSLMPSQYQLIRTEENISLIDLIFPLDNSSSWDPTALIDANTNYLIRGKGIQLFKDWPAAYVQDTYTSMLFGQEREVIEVRDVNPDDNIILYQSSKRTYALGLGLILKEQAFFTTQKTELASSPWEEKADIGFKCTQTLIDFQE